jgi:hypothetical protein
MLEAVRAAIPEPRRLAPLSILRKADEIVWDKGVTPISPYTFAVESATGFHLVKEQPDGTLKCDCLGCQNCGVCSHMVAVAITIEKGRT